MQENGTYLKQLDCWFGSSSLDSFWLKGLIERVEILRNSSEPLLFVFDWFGLSRLQGQIPINFNMNT